MAQKDDLLNALETLSASTVELIAATAVSAGILWMLGRLLPRNEADRKKNPNPVAMFAVCVMLIVTAAGGTGVLLSLGAKLLPAFRA